VKAINRLVQVTTGAKTATGNSGAAIPCEDYEFVNVFLNVTAVSGTTPSMTVSVEWSFDGTNFAAAEGVTGFAAITAAKKTAMQFRVVAPYFRLAWTISGTTPSLTTDAQAYLTQPV
jgi:hypothetical protein